MKEFIEKLIGRLEEYKKKAYVTGITNNAYEFGACNAMDSAIKIVNQLAEEYNNGWIPFTQRELTTEEKEEFDCDFDYMLTCKLPEDDTEILVCYKNGLVGTDTFFNDCGNCYLDSGNDFIEDAIAWMPLPPAYVPEEGRE